MNIAFTTTATNRPEIIERTYTSFCENINGINFKDTTLFINIDPAPNTINIKEGVRVARRFFGKVIYNMPSVPNFSAAINWLWSQATTPYIFHLEDDWVLKRPINIGSMLKAMEQKDVEHVALRAYKHKYHKMCLSPSLISQKLYGHVAGKLRTDINPELQLRSKEIVGFNFRARHVVVLPRDIRTTLIRDIGRKWMQINKIRRPAKKVKFFKWAKN
jgi:hypothetical protein